MSDSKTPFSGFGFPPFDPGKMDPKVMLELSQVVRSLPPEKVNQMQSLMHNMMAGFDVRREMEEFEKSLPEGFREKLMSIMAGQSAATAAQSTARVVEVETTSSEEMNIREARMTVLKAVADGSMSPEQAEQILFPG